MDQFIDDDLFSGMDFNGLINQLSLSTGLQMEGAGSDDIFESLFSDGMHNEQVATTEPRYPSEFEAVMLDFQNDSQNSFDGIQPSDDTSVQQNAVAIELPIPKEASGNEDGIKYQMYPALFDGLITGVMDVKEQPKANNRVRYECDGSRFLPNSRYRPLALGLPELQSIKLNDNQQLGIVITMISDTFRGKFVHANDIIYRVDGAKKLGYACTFVPMDSDEIKNGEKKFPRLSIMYKKSDEFTYDLIPFDPASMFGTAAPYTTGNTRNLTTAAKAKLFKEDYNLLSYRFVFHLALKEDDVVYISNVICETEIINEEKATTPIKRSASDAQPSRSSKKLKRLSSQNIGLPVTRMSNANA